MPVLCVYVPHFISCAHMCMYECLCVYICITFHFWGRYVYVWMPAYVYTYLISFLVPREAWAVFKIPWNWGYRQLWVIWWGHWNQTQVLITALNHEPSLKPFLHHSSGSQPIHHGDLSSVTHLGESITSHGRRGATSKQMNKNSDKLTSTGNRELNFHFHTAPKSRQIPKGWKWMVVDSGSFAVCI